MLKFNMKDCLEVVNEVEKWLLKNEKDEYIDKAKNDTNQTTYCKYHESNGHSTENYRKLKEKNNNDNDKQNRISVIEDSMEGVPSMKLSGEINNKDTVIFIDPGATKCYINEKLTNELNSKLVNITTNSVILVNN